MITRKQRDPKVTRQLNGLEWTSNGLLYRKSLTFTTSNSTPMAGSGVRMSLNMITPSGLKARQGCRESSIAMSGVSERCRNPYLLEYSRNSYMYLPALRINQTGGRSACSPRATRSKRGSLEEPETIGTLFLTAPALGIRVLRP